MDRIQSLEVFVAVAEAESFAGGARSVGLSAPSVTRGISGLEERLGARLFTRTTRTVRLTEVGAAYLDDARSILSHFRAANDAAAGAAANPVGRLRITCSHEFGRIYVTPILTAYLDTYPDVTVEVVVVDRIVNMVEEGFDIAVRIGALPSSGLSAVRVGSVRRVICGAPAYLARHGAPTRLEDLREHQLVSASPNTPDRDWRFGREGTRAVRIRPRLVLGSVAAGIEVARQGWGLCQVLSYQIGPDLEAGTLRTVLDAHAPAPLPVHLVHVEGRRAAAKVRSFIDFAAERLRAMPALQAARADP
ncbi:LysR family transcriptional regulator [uncultured Roseobacter sp.]|uniref:LysR family transcriptional regulator n=1 Tax=uncultured Roseobacter sp. TaxID=114847 RepID=UPI002601E7D4|nr:LysR family transcriptional regulator [uncultured Roseobacter sp.]